MPTFEYDLRYLQAGAGQLEAYLLAGELYWPIGVNPPKGQPPYPQLTPGGLLLARQRLGAIAETPAQQAELTRLEQRLEALQAHWRMAWGKKASQDFHARLKLWRNFLEEYREKPSAHYDRYTYEVTRRVQLHLLAPEAVDLPLAETQALDGLDQLLRAVFRSGSFVWEERLAAGFPPAIFWYLYGRLREEIIEAAA
jgi:hypothetical protein